MNFLTLTRRILVWTLPMTIFVVSGGKRAGSFAASATAL